MPFDDFLKAVLPLKEMYKPNTITVAITGGEPILRKDLPECGRKLRENGFRWGIVTNGYGYTPEIHGSLLGAGMGSLTLSLDGLEPTHNWLRANNKSFARAVKALELITASTRLNYDVVTCVNQKNIDELESLREFLISQNVKAWRLFTISPIGRAADNEILQLTPRQLKQLMEFIVHSRSDKSRDDKRMEVTFSCEAWLGDYELAARDTYFFCRAGIQIASVLIDGSISACPNINRDFVQGNIYRDNFADVWNNRFEIMRDRRWTKTGICLTCKDYKNCLGGAMHLWNGKKDGIMNCIHQKVESVR
jgi:radical SAM enzyme (rSAM/lipoprotein system)